MDKTIGDSAMMREASRLAAVGNELGNTDAIRLLQIPHSVKDVEDVLRVFENQLTREAQSKLTLDALVAPPPGVVNQRYEPLFDKYIITGKTYTTASGAVIPNELQYYNGEMAHLYGECTNVAAVSESLLGSGYKPVTLRNPDGGQTAVAQLWSSRFTDTTIGPYGAMFMVVVAVPDAAPANQTSLPADPNGASSVLVMLDGTFERASGVYQNRALLFLVRLLDTTQVAIDVGRERMGTDKRPGTIDMTRNGRRLRMSIKDARGRGVARADLELADDPAAYMPAVEKAAATAGISVRPLPRGTEYAYPSVARIDRGRVVSWQWRSDLVPLLQPVTQGAVAFDSSSEEGRMLLTWGFTPKVLGYIPNVRGVITGLEDPKPRHVAANPVAPSIRPSQLVSMRARRYSDTAGLVIDSPDRGVEDEKVRLVRTTTPGAPRGMAGELPVLRLIAQASRFGAPLKTPACEEPPLGAGATSSQPRWAWETTFLGSLTATLRKEVVGVTPDGLRINWHVKTGTFTGPGLDAIVLPGAADWMRIRRDGAGIVSVQACFETQDGARVFGSYGGIFDLGPDGYNRALRDEYDHLPPVVVTPTYATADPRLQWLNRAQCIGVGRVDMTAFRVEFDVYVVRVGDRVRQPAASALPTSLYARLGGHDVIRGVTEDFVEAVLADRQLARFFPGARDEPGLKKLKERVIELLCELTGGPCVYKGRDMKTTHKGLGINETDWTIAVDLFAAALDRCNVPRQARAEFVQIIEDMKNQVVEGPG